MYSEDLDFEGWSSESKSTGKKLNQIFTFHQRATNPDRRSKRRWELIRRDTISLSNQFTGTQIAGMLIPMPEFSTGHSELTDHEFSNHRKSVLERFQYMLDHKITKKSDLPVEMRTKKFNQKPLPSKWEKKPTMTVTSLPDDYIHYSKPRTFSVREWARMQTFPDCHQFSGPRTTGGERRAGNPDLGNWSRDVPK